MAEVKNRRAVRAYEWSASGVSYAEIGRRLGVTRQRALQLVYLGGGRCRCGKQTEGWYRCAGCLRLKRERERASYKSKKEKRR